MELQNLQQQLKVAIQSHQNVVSKMKADPQNTVLQKQLHELQAEIKTLSEKQKQVVQQLRKEIEIKQNHIQQGNDVNHETITAQSTPLPLVKTSDLLSLKTLPFTTTTTNTTLAPKLNSEQNKSVHVNSPVHVNVKNSANENNNNNNNTNNVGIITNALNLTPAIRVPQYPPPCLRPSVTQPQLRPPCLTSPPPLRGQVLSPVCSSKETQLPKTNNNINNNIINSNINNINNSVNNNTNVNNNNNNNNNDIYLKVDFMAALGLITHDTLSELQNRRSERKRRTTANPQFSYGNWDLSDKRRKPNNYLTSPLPLNFRKPRGRPRLGSTPNNSCPATPDDGSSNKGSPNDGTGGVLKNGASMALDEICSVCQNQGDLLHCDTCMLSYHRTCVDCSPVDSTTPSSWVCPKCQLMRKTPLHWPGSLAMVHSYIAHKAAKEEEKRKLVKRSLELKSEHSQLEVKAKQLSETIERQVHKRNELVLCIQQMQESIDVLKKLIKHFQGS